MKYRIMDGNEACATVSYGFTEVAGIYPITPSSPMAELTDSWSSSGLKNHFGSPVRIVEMQSEAGAAGMIHGSLQVGCLTTTYTASQGLLLMIPNMYKMAGEQLPCVIHVAARSISTHALSILGDHQDIYATRMTGFAILAESSVQQVMDLSGVAHLAAIRGKVPFLNFFDGFRTSHELQKIEVIDTDKLKKLIDKKSLDEFRRNSLHPETPVTKGTAQNDDIYFQATEVRNTYYNALPEIVSSYMKEIEKITGREYRPFNYYGVDDAEKIIIAMGSVCETVRETIDVLIQQGEKVGMIEVHLYRPFAIDYLLSEIPDSVKRVAVLDRTKEAGSHGEPLYLDVVEALSKNRNDISIIGGRYGLSSKNTTPGMIKSVYDFLDNESRFTGFTIGIDDDVTNMSLKESDWSVKSNNIEFLVYGYGSDGMVSACKDIMKITGTYSNAFVQGYFQYDSKKSGGVTKSHLRFSKGEIHSTYYVERANIIVCTKESYLKKFEIIKDIKENGIFLLNTSAVGTDIEQLFTEEDKGMLKEKNVRLYVVDANKITSSVGLSNKISSVMEAAIFKLGKIIDYEFAIDKMKENIDHKFSQKGNSLVEKNIEVLDMLSDSLVEVAISSFSVLKDNNVKGNSIFEMMDRREGDKLPVSSFNTSADGHFDAGLSSLEKRGSSDTAPSFLKENCIQCNLCSFVCPHAVIRPFLLTEDEVLGAPDSLKDQLLDVVINDENLKYVIAASIPDCTGCSLCANICPGKKKEKALVMTKIDDIDLDRKKVELDYLLNCVSEKRVFPITTVKGSQFRTPKFEFSGACAGCGETPYLKLITQLFGDRMVISNATGCSSIYSASAPSTAYSVPWASSLFEDNAEYGYGMSIADGTVKRRICGIIEENISNIDDGEIDIYTNYLDDITDKSGDELCNIVDNSTIDDLKELKDFIKKKSFWIVGGDGWAYDIGFGGIDHVLANHENVNILVLDTEVYSNTGGQSSKSSRIGSIAKFTSKGKDVAKKDLAKIALTYPHVYVGSISMGANPQHTLKTLLEAESYDGPSIVFAYSPCIAQGILSGMESSIDEGKKAVVSGYYPLFHFDPRDGIFKLDSKADFDKYYEFIAGEDRYKMLKKINPDKYHELLEQNKEFAISRYKYYEKLALDTKKEEIE